MAGNHHPPASRRISLVPGSTPSVAQRRAAIEQSVRAKTAGSVNTQVVRSPGNLRSDVNNQNEEQSLKSNQTELDTHSSESPTKAPRPSSGVNKSTKSLLETPESIHSTTSLLSRCLTTSIRPRRLFNFGVSSSLKSSPSFYSRWGSATPEPISSVPTTTKSCSRSQTEPNSSTETVSSTLSQLFGTASYDPPRTHASNSEAIVTTTITAPLAAMSPQALQTMTEDNTSDGAVVIPRLEDLLRHPEDLDKISALKAEYLRRKENVDSQLRDGLRDQLELVQRSINNLKEGQAHVLETRDELQGIDKLCAASRAGFSDFAQVDNLTQIQRNFEATIMMKKGLESFHHDLGALEGLLREDDEDLENQPNLLNAHMALTKLRDFRDEAMDQIRKAEDRSSESTLLEWFDGLDPAIEWFDDHLGTACMNIIPLVQSDNGGMVVRLAVVISNEEKNDAKVKALQDAQKDHEYLASRFKSMNIGPKTIRGYKQNFLKSIEFYAQAQFEASKEAFLDDPDRLEKGFKWFFNDLFTVKQGMQALVPKKWKIYKTYTDIYHKMMHDWLIEFVDDPQLPAANMLSIINWTEKYYKKMAKLGWKQSDLVPNVIDDREGELVREWRNLIVKALDEWIDRMFITDKKSFIERDADSLETNHEGFIRTKTLGDMWRMIHEQLMAAGASQRTDVAEGVVDAMFRSLKTRQSLWQTLVDEECAKYKGPGIDQSEHLQQLQDWLIALANDQIACIDDNYDSGQLGYLTRFQRDFEPLVRDEYMPLRADKELISLRDGYVDLSTHCISVFIDLIFSVDFRTTLPDFFTQKWYGEFAMKRMISTFEDYMSDYQSILHPSLRDILVEEISDELLVYYLSCIRNRGAKFRRNDPYTDKFKDDVLTIFSFFQKFPESFAGGIKDRWRLVDWLVRLLEAEKGPPLVSVYEAFKTEYWDLQLSWVEAVLRSRDDFERSMISAVKAKAAEMSVDRGPDTIMGKVR